MNELTFTVLAQILHFGLLWYILHTFLLKKVFTVIKTERAELVALENSVATARQALKDEEENKKEEWKKFVTEFSEKIPYKGCELPQGDTTPLCHIAPGLKQEEKEIVVKDTVNYIVRKIVHDK